MQNSVVSVEFLPVKYNVVVALKSVIINEIKVANKIH